MLRHPKIKTVGFFKKASPARFFVLVSGIFGLVFLVITPPFQTPDEQLHFYRAYQISTLNFVPDYVDHVLGGTLPKSLKETYTITSTSDIKFYPNKKYSWYKTADAFSIKTEPKETESYRTSSALFTPIMYIPQSIAVLIARIMHAPPILMMYMARLAVLITWIALFSLAIKLMPRQKWTFAFIGLLPMVLFQAISLGGDALIMGLTAVFFAYILFLRETAKHITNIQLAKLILIGSLLILCKGIMLIFLPLLLLLPWKTAALNWRVYAVKICLALLIPLIFLGLWMFMIRGVDVNASYLLANEANTSEQFQNIISHPSAFINSLWNLYFLNWGDHISRSVIGFFGWMDTPLPESMVVVGYIGLALMFFANSERKLTPWLKRREKLLLGLIMLAFWLMVNVVTYLTNTPVNIKLIYGLQGRYFLPLLLILTPLLYSSWLKINPRAYRTIAMRVPLFLLSASAIIIWFRFYLTSI